MHIFQRIHLKQLCQRNGIDEAYIDDSLTYDENIRELERFIQPENKEKKWLKEYEIIQKSLVEDSPINSKHFSLREYILINYERQYLDYERRQRSEQPSTFLGCLNV